MPLYYDSLDLSGDEKLKFYITVIIAGLLTGVLFYDSVTAGIAASVFYSITKPLYKKSMNDRHKNELLLQFRDLLYSISSSVSSGRNMTQALEESADFWDGTYDESDYIIQELRYMINRIRNSNENDISVLRDFAVRSGLEDVSDFVSVYESCKGTGGNLPQAISRATSIIGDKISLERDLKTRLAEKLFEGRIVAVSPLLIVGLLKVMSPEYMEPMYSTGSGRAVMTIALILMGTALMLIEKLNRLEV